MSKKPTIMLLFAAFMALCGSQPAMAYEPDLAVSCGSHWFAAEVILYSDSNEGVVSFDGDSNPTRQTTPASFTVASNTGVIEITFLDETGGMLELTPVSNPQSNAHIGWLARIKLDTNADWRDMGWCY